MRDAIYDVTPLELREATDPQLEAVNELRNALMAERQPDDPPAPARSMMHRMRNVPPFLATRAWTAADARGQLVGFAVIYLPRTEENRHVAEFALDVHAAHRRRGIGRRLVTCVVEAAERDGRRLLVTSTNARVPAGDAVMRRLGATRGLVSQVHQLDLARLDHELVDAWRAGTPDDAYALELWDGAYPDEELPAILALHEVMNAQPRDALDVEDERMTAEHLREIERTIFDGSTSRWTFVARERASGALVGFTVIYLDAERPDLARQGDTGVFPEHRGKGIGRGLKASMLDELVRTRPSVRLVRTSNADSNAAMRSINEALGFEPYATNCLWQIPTERVRVYLDRADARAPHDGSDAGTTTRVHGGSTGHVFTVGYEGATPGSFVATLLEHGVTRVIDVRYLPSSRKRGFSKTPLTAALAEVGIAYEHVRALGTPPDTRRARRDGMAWAEFDARYRAHLMGQGEALERVAARVRAEPVALLCLEADAHACHRSIVAEALVHDGAASDAVHLDAR